MNVDAAELRTARGDVLLFSLVELPGEEPTILVSLDDPDETEVPTAELTLREAGDAREILRRFCTRAVRAGRGSGGWTTVR